MKWKHWLESEDGKKCADYSTLESGVYLENRLWRAFRAAGEDAGEKRIADLTAEVERQRGLLQECMVKLTYAGSAPGAALPGFACNLIKRVNAALANTTGDTP